jgi:hypothetical protein
VAELRKECSALELDERGGERLLRAAGVHTPSIAESEARCVESLRGEIIRMLRAEHAQQLPAEPGVQ